MFKLELIEGALRDWDLVFEDHMDSQYQYLETEG